MPSTPAHSKFTESTIAKFIDECNNSATGNIVIDSALVDIHKSFGKIGQNVRRKIQVNSSDEAQFLIVFVGNSDYTLHTNFKIHAYTSEGKFPGNLHDEVVFGEGFKIKESSREKSIMFESTYSAVPQTDNRTGSLKTNFFESATYLHVIEYKFKDPPDFKRFSQLLKLSPNDLIINLRQNRLPTLSLQHGSHQDYERLIRKRVKNLRVLNVERNRLRGFPRSFHKSKNRFEKLEELNISNNDFTFIHNQFIQNINPKLRRLDLSCNRIDRLEDQDLGENFKEGKRWVSDIRKLADLEYLNLYGNCIYQPPKWLCDFSKLRELNLSKNQSLSSLDDLPLDRLVSLEILDIRENCLVSLPDSLCDMLALKVLDATDNYISRIPESIDGLSKTLESINLSKNELRELPDGIGRLENLKFLDISENVLENIDFLNQQKMYSLEDFVCYTNMIVKIPASIGHCHSLKRFECNRNQVMIIPQNIGNCTNLEELVLNDNRILVIPDTLKYLSSMINLDLNKNRLSEIPDEIYSLRQLRVLCLRENELDFISPKIGQLSELAILDLADNCLKNLPVEILKLQDGPKLKAIWLSLNQSQSTVQFLPDGQYVTCYLLPQKKAQDNHQLKIKTEMNLAPPDIPLARVLSDRRAANRASRSVTARSDAKMDKIIDHQIQNDSAVDVVGILTDVSSDEEEDASENEADVSDHDDEFEPVLLKDTRARLTGKIVRKDRLTAMNAEASTDIALNNLAKELNLNQTSTKKPVIQNPGISAMFQK